MATVRKQPTLDKKLARCVIAITADSAKPRLVTDPVERGHYEWLKRKLYDTMSAIYGVENNPLKRRPRKPKQRNPKPTRRKTHSADSGTSGPGVKR
jgi:hypothetical protein